MTQSSVVSVLTVFYLKQCVGFTPHQAPKKTPVQIIYSGNKIDFQNELVDATTATSSPPQEVKTASKDVDRTHWSIGPTFLQPNPPLLSPEITTALETYSHPMELMSDLGKGRYLLTDWRRNYHTYQSPSSDPDLIDPETGYADYEVDVEGGLPHDLVGILYRNGPGKFGVGGERVVHTLDADGLIIKITIPPPQPDAANDDRSPIPPRKVTFRSRFVETRAFVEERDAQKFLYRGTFGTGPRGPDWLFGEPSRNGLDAEPSVVPLASRVAGNALRTDIKNTANTQVVSFGGKLLALFEAGLPHAIDPETLVTLGEDDLGGALSEGLPVKLGMDQIDELAKGFIGGSAHTAHPNVCPKTGNLVGWSWSQLVTSKSMEITFTEWSPETFEPVASFTHEVAGCELAPHDMAITDDSILLKVNALEMQTAQFLSGVSGPAASLKMDGRAPVRVLVFPRPTSSRQFEPYEVEVPACFSIHFSHAHEDVEKGRIVSYFSGWPPSDSKDFLGAWGGFAPDFAVIPPTYLWRLEIDTRLKTCVDLRIVEGAEGCCVEHPLVHPAFVTKKAKNVYVSASNVVGDSSAPAGFIKFRLDEEQKEESSGSNGQEIKGTMKTNAKVDAWWPGTRYFTGEPLIVPKVGGNPDREEDAYLLGMVKDAARDRSFVAVFDLERDLKEGPVCKLWLKSSVPHGLHGCFAADDEGSSSVFC